MIHQPYFYSTDGTFLGPQIGKMTTRNPYLSDELVPVEFEKAMRVVWSQAPLEDKVLALEDIYRSEGMASPWRLRALGALARLQAKAGDLAQAAEEYRKLFQEFEPVLLESTSPSYFELVVARTDCLVAAGQGEEARDLVVRALEKIRSKTAGSTTEEEQFFLARTKDLFRKTGGPAPAFLKEIDQVHREKQHLLGVLEALRGSIPKKNYRGDLEPDLHHFFGESEEIGSPSADGATGETSPPILTVWTRAPPAPSRPGLRLVGFKVNIDGLERLLNDRLSVSLESHLKVEARASHRDGDLMPLTTLAGDRGFLQIGIGPEVWSDLVGKAQRPFFFAGVLLGFLALALSLGLMTFFRGIRREMALSRMKTEFVANVSHELKTPLALIRLFGETLLLERVADPVQRRKYYETIVRESERLTHLISNVLNFASIEAGKKHYELLSCELGDVVRSTYESYRPHLDEKGFSHRLEVEPGLPKVLADPDAVSQAVINLLENAVKYSSRKKVVSLKVSRRDESVVLSVADCGVGISPEDQGRIWEGYYRTKEARALGTRGSGLGLSVVMHIMKAHGGQVELASQVSQGSEFSLIFPASRERSAPRRGGG